MNTLIKRYLIFLSVISINLNCIVNRIYADDGVYIDYCDGTLATASKGTVTGKAGSGTVELAIRIPATTLQAYISNQITKIYTGIPLNATALPDSITVWVRESQNGMNIACEKIKTRKGWMNTTLTSPYTITGKEDELWVGFSWNQTSKLSIISFAGPTNANGCWLGKDGVWTDFSNKELGSMAIRAYVEGKVPTSDLEMTSLYTGLNIYAFGQDISVKGEIRNKAIEKAINPIIKWNLILPDSTTIVLSGEETVPKTLSEGGRTDFTFTIPTDDLSIEGNYTIRCEVCWADGREDDFVTDNAISIPVEVAKEVFLKKMVVEEGTGTWCGYCVRGIVALRDMKELHPERFIGLAVHQGDEFKLSYPYLNSRFSTYPNSIINRDGNVIAPLTDTYKKYYDAMNTVAEANIDVTAICRDKTITATADITYGLTASNRDMRVVFLLVEDSLLADQTNYFAGGGLGEMSGFEAMSNPCSIYLDDVVRGAWPDTYGTKGNLPTNFTKGEHAQYQLSFKLPSAKTTTVSNPLHTWMCALLIDGETGEILNAGTTHQIYGYNCNIPFGIEYKNDNKNDNLKMRVYNLAGQCVSDYYKGIVIINGKKQLNK